MNQLLRNFTFTVFLVISNGFYVKQNQSDVSTIQALCDVVSELYLSKNLTCDIFVIGEVSLRVGDKINALIKHFQGSQSIKVTRTTSIDFTEVPNTALVFVSSNLVKRINKIGLQRWLPGINKVLFYFDHENKLDLNLLKINITHHNDGINPYSYYFVDDERKIELKTFEWWTETVCNHPQLITMNTFDKVSETWQTNFNIQDKFLNFHGCTLNSKSENFHLFFLDFLRFYGFIDLNPGFRNDYVKKERIEARLASIFAQHGNFSIYRTAYDIFTEKSETYVFYQEGNGYGVNVLQSEVCSIPLYDVSLYIVFSPPEPYSNYEKMVLPFDGTTWIFLMITFGVSFLIIWYLHFLPQQIQDVFFGRRVRTALFNVVRAGFGIPQTILPENHFGRILLVFFLLFCLVLRTAYQGVFFTLMTADLRQKPPRTIEDLNERNYTLYLPSEFQLRVVLLVFLQNRVQHFGIMKFDELNDLFNNLNNSTLKAMIFTDIDYRVIRSYHAKPPEVLSEKIHFGNLAVCTKTFNYASQLVIEVMSKLMPTGIPQYLHNYLMEFEFRPLIAPPDEPRVLRLSDLEFGFIVWLIAVGISTQSIKVTKTASIDLKQVHNTALVFVSPKLVRRINELGLQRWLPGTNRVLFYLDHENRNNLNLLKINLTHNTRTIAQYSYYFVDNRREVELKTFEWWTEAACNQPQLITLNTFDKTSGKWKSKLNIQDKFFNFHGCTLNSKSETFKLFFLDYMRFYGLIDINPGFRNDYVKKERIEARLASIFAQQGNFSIYRTAYDIFAEESENYVFFQAGNNYFVDIMHHEVCSVPLYDVFLYIVYSPPEPYSNYEKMVLPFDGTTWIFLMITFGVSFLIIWYLHFLPQQIQDVFFGRRVRTALFNVVRAGFGIQQTILPENHFGRILLVFFLLFCLVFRTAYQGVFFKLMTTDVRRKPPRTIEDLNERNYTLYLPTEYQLQLALRAYLKNRVQNIGVMRLEELNDLFYKLHNSSLKAAMIFTDIDYRVIRAYNVYPPNVMNEKIDFGNLAVCTRTLNFASQLVIEVMLKLMPTGIPQYLHKYLMEFEFRPLIAPPVEPFVFSLSDLEFGFIVWLIAAAMSTAVFFLEILFYFLRVKFVEVVHDVVGLICLLINTKRVLCQNML